MSLKIVMKASGVSACFLLVFLDSFMWVSEAFLLGVLYICLLALTLGFEALGRLFHTFTIGCVNAKREARNLQASHSIEIVGLFLFGAIVLQRAAVATQCTLL
jgi:hypothetical protein